LGAHKQQHQLRLNELNEIQQKSEGEFSEEECSQLAKLFRHWLLDHLVKEDMLLRRWLSGNPA